MDLKLQGKTALVAASTKGLGFATAQILLEEGANVAICGRNRKTLPQSEAMLREISNNVLAIEADVTNPRHVQRLVSQTIDKFGGIDILVTNAGGPPSGSFDTISLEAYEQAFQLTLMSAINLIHIALPHLRKSDAPSILTVTSVSVKEPIANLLLSNVMRPAVIGLTKTLANELGPEGIRVNSILPGYTRTERVVYLAEQRAKEGGTTVEAVHEKTISTIPLGRMGEPEEFGRTAAFLVSPAASYITGTMVQVDGGRYSGLM